MCGGISTKMKRYAKANNPYLQYYDPVKDTSYILYLDANNLSGWAMSQPLPVGNFRWAKKDANQKTNHVIASQPQNRLNPQVDLEYPQDLHEKHNSYPLAPERTQVPEEWYSPNQQDLARELELTKDKTEKLLLTLKDKNNYMYVLHYRNLQLYLSLGINSKKCTPCSLLTRLPGWSLISERGRHQTSRRTSSS